MIKGYYKWTVSIKKRLISDAYWHFINNGFNLNVKFSYFEIVSQGQFRRTKFVFNTRDVWCSTYDTSCPLSEMFDIKVLAIECTFFLFFLFSLSFILVATKCLWTTQNKITQKTKILAWLYISLFYCIFFFNFPLLFFLFFF